MTREADIIEEVLRIHGFQQVPLAENLSTDFLAEHPVKDVAKLQYRLTEMLANQGYFELVTNSLTSPKYVEKAGFFIGSLVLTSKTSLVKNENYIVVDAKAMDSEEVTYQVLDKGYVTDKEYKKLSKSLKKMGTYLANNEDDFHIKILN